MQKEIRKNQLQGKPTSKKKGVSEKNRKDYGFSSGKKAAYMGLFVALALICSYVEALIPIPIGIPGVKLGLANLVTVMALYLFGTREALCISVLRILLSGFLFGNAFSILYSLAGGFFSFLAMWLCKRTNLLHVISVSITGGLAHNIAQLAVAAVIVSNYKILYYIPVLLAAGVLTGLVIGILSQELIMRLHSLQYNAEI